MFWTLLGLLRQFEFQVKIPILRASRQNWNGASWPIYYREGTGLSVKKASRQNSCGGRLFLCQFFACQVFAYVSDGACQFFTYSSVIFLCSKICNFYETFRITKILCSKICIFYETFRITKILLKRCVIFYETFRITKILLKRCVHSFRLVLAEALLKTRSSKEHCSAL